MCLRKHPDDSHNLNRPQKVKNQINGKEYYN